MFDAAASADDDDSGCCVCSLSLSPSQAPELGVAGVAGSSCDELGCAPRCGADNDGVGACICSTFSAANLNPLRSGIRSAEIG